MDIREATNRFRSAGKIREWSECVIDLYREERDYAAVRELRGYLRKNIEKSPEDYMRLLRSSYILTAPDYFEDYMIGMEWDRENKFYLPRRVALHNMVLILQDLTDDKADIACISMPPGTGKSGVGILYCTFLGGRDPINGILTLSHKTDFLAGAYNETLREISSPEYNWNEIFPGRKVVLTDAKRMQIGVDKAQRFNTFQFASILADLAGQFRAKQLLYNDDLIGSTEEAFNIERLNTKWLKYSVDAVQRKSGPCKELDIATRWSVHDIIGRLTEMHEGDPRFRVLNIPATNEEETISNFDYGNIRDSFPLERFMQIKATMDSMSYGALYMGQPVEREGLVYQRDDLRRYINLPEGDPDAILGVCDPAEGGGDDTVLPVFRVYGNDHYLVDAVVTDALPEISDAYCTQVIIRQGVQKCQFESNAAGGRTADKVNEKVRSTDHYCHITKKKNTGNKETRIIVESDWIKEHVLFPDERLIDKKGMVAKLMTKLCSYSHMGKNPHDDVPDAMAQYAQFFRGLTGQKVELIPRKNYFL